MEIRYTRTALKVLRRMPRNWSQRIRARIEEYAADPASQANNVTALQGRDALRLRVGDWRVIMNHNGDVLDILNMGQRGGIYRQERNNERHYSTGRI